MRGIIIFADDDIFNSTDSVNPLFLQFLNSQEEDISIVPVQSLRGLEELLNSVSTIRCLILDWSYKNPLQNYERKNSSGESGENLEEEEDFENLILPDQTPFSLLKDIDLYCPIYVYSRNEINEVEKQILKSKFRDKIKFKLKNIENDPDIEYNYIWQEIKELETKNIHMTLPKKWSQSINRIVQKIFVEFEKANPCWITEIKNTAEQEGTDGILDVIGIFQNVLTQNIINDISLRNAIEEYKGEDNNDPSMLTKLYRYIMYLYINSDSPISTGDIFKFENGQYGILISPECDLGKLDNLAFLIVENESFKREVLVDLDKKKFDEASNRQQTKLRKKFNNPIESCHYLPSFPFNENLFEGGKIDFKTGLKIINKSDILKRRSSYRLMPPFIHQIRQRFISSFGRFGVPTIPDKFKDLHFKQ